MENKNIILLKHHPMNVKFTNTFYLNQTDNGDLSDYVIIDVTSRIERNKEFMKEHPTFAIDLSPFFIGPVISSDGVTANIFEIFWQCGKVYPCHNDNCKPNEEYFKWRNEMFAKKKLSKKYLRHPNKMLNCEHSDTLYFLHYNKDRKEYEKLNFVDSRKKFYVEAYAKYAVNTDSYKWLKSLVDSGKKIALVDFDAFNYYDEVAKTKIYNSYINKCKKKGWTPKQSLEDFLNIKNMNDFYDASFISTGHASVLKMLLEGDIEVIDDKIIDHIGVLTI